MAKIEWTTKRNLGRAGASMFGFLVGTLTKFESLMTLAIMLGDGTASCGDYWVLLVPIFFSLFFFMLYWLYLKIIDWKNLQLDRIKALEKRIKDLSNQEEKHQLIENNHLIQHRVNEMIADEFNNMERPNLHMFLQGEGKLFEEFVTRKNNKQISGAKAQQILDQYNIKDRHFHEPN